MVFTQRLYPLNLTFFEHKLLDFLVKTAIVDSSQIANSVWSPLK